MSALIRFLIRHRGTALILVLIGAGAALLEASGLKIDNSLEVWFVEDDPALVSYLDFCEAFGCDEIVVTAIRGPGPALSVERLARLADLTRDLVDTDGVARVQSLTSVAVPQMSMGQPVLPLISEPIDAVQVQRARTAVSGSRLAARFVGRDGKTLVVHTFLEQSPDLDARRSRILDAIRASVRASLGPGERASHGGIGVLYDDLNRATFGEGAVFLGLSYAAVALALLLVLRRLLWLVLALAVVALADLFLFGAMAWLDRPINMITMALPALVMILGVANIVHMATALESTFSQKPEGLSRLTASLASVAVPCFSNTCTTAGGFLSLTAASMAITRGYGLCAALGIVFASFLALLGTATALPLMTGSRPRQRSLLATTVERAMLFSMRHRGAVGSLTVLLTGLAIAGAARIRVDTFSMDFLPRDHSYRRENAAIEATVGPYVPLEFTVQVPEAGDRATAHFIESMGAAQTALEADPEIGLTLSIADVLRDLQPAPSLPTPKLGQGAGQSVALLAEEGAEKSLGQLVADDGRTLRLAATTRMASAAGFREVAERAQVQIEGAMGQLAQVNLSGYLPLYSQMIAHILDDQISSFALAFAVVFVLVAWVLRSWRLTLAAVAPNLLPVTMVLGVMGGAGIRLDVATVTIAAAILGIVVDDTVHILYRLRRALPVADSLEEAMSAVARESGVAVVTTSFIFCAGFSVVALASVRSVALVGLLTTVGVASALVTDVLLLPVIVSLLFGGHTPPQFTPDYGKPD